MFEKKFKVQYQINEPLLGVSTKTKKYSESQLNELKERDDVKIISIDGKFYRKS